MSVLLVVGHGMVGQHLVEEAVARGLHERYRMVVVGEEPRLAYDRVHLSSWFEGVGADALTIKPPSWFDDHGIEMRVGTRVEQLDTGRRIAVVDDGTPLGYEQCVLSTGSRPFVPPIPGIDASGVFVYRTIADLEAIEEYAAGSRRGVVVGGGLLGLEAANALRLLGVETHVVEFAPRLMPVQLDDGGARLLRREIEALGVIVHCDRAAQAVRVDQAGRATGLAFADGSTLEADLVVFSAGIRPRDDLAWLSGIAVAERGGVVIDDTGATSAPNVWAVGECANHRGRVYGLVAPGYRMAEVVAARIAGDTDAAFMPPDLSTRLKLVGVEVASIGDPHAVGREVVFGDATAGHYRKLVVDESGALVGAVLVGDTSLFTPLAQMVTGVMATPRDLAPLIGPAAVAPKLQTPDAAAICSCHNITKGTICAAIRGGELLDVSGVKQATKAGTGCGSCVPVLKELLESELAAAGKAVSNHLCEHFAMSRTELFATVRATRTTSFGELVARHGRGRGCAICKPAVASMLAALSNGYILDGEQATLQDTNDHVLANLQRDGSYSVIPRIPGGEVTPDGLVAIGQVAKRYDLTTKITGGQRIDLLGARIEQLPAIWADLIAAGFESGHAYGKALRTVKSCVGDTWCRYGVQDSVTMAIDLELRYRGLRAPHKIKMAVSGCARECAEAQGKDVGVIATERGWNLYVAGNGGMRPRHATLLATDLDRTELFRLVDRFLAYYIRTADRLERTSVWFAKLADSEDAAVAHLRAVLVDDSLGIAADLDADIARHVDSYECEWAATLASPERLARFRHFANDDRPDPSLVYEVQRGQKIPVRAAR